MSSFRIERQYVSFTTVETPNVHPVRRTADGRDALLSGADDRLECGPQEGYSADQIARALVEAEKKADQILRRAETDAAGVLAGAEARAREIVGEAQKSAEGIRQAAQAEGLARGEKKAAGEAETRRRAEAEQLRQLVDGLKNDYDAYLGGITQDVKSLVMEIARKIINVKLRESDEVFLGLVNEGIDRLRQAGYLVIRVCPEDYARYFGGDVPEALLGAGGIKVAAEEDESFGPGDLVIESEGEMLNLSVERQLRQVEQALSE